MARIENSPGEQHTLELLARPSSDLNAALQEFVRVPRENDPPELTLGRKAFDLIQLRSQHVAQVSTANDPNREDYGGDSIELRRYKRELENVAKNKIKVSEAENRANFMVNRNGDGLIWLTMDPTSQEMEAITREPLYSSVDRESPDLGLYFIVRKPFFVGPTEAHLALNSLHSLLRHEEAMREQQKAISDEAQREAAERGMANPASATVSPRRFFVTQLRTRQFDRRVRPPQTQSRPDIDRAA